MAEKELYYLNELSDYKMASDQPDIRGWKIKDADGRTAGKVDDLLIHKRSERVVYIDVEVDPEIIDVGRDPFQDQDQDAGVREYMNKDGDNHLIIPIGLIDIDEKNKLVLTDAIDHTTFRNTRRHSKGSQIDRGHEVEVYNSYVPPSDDDNAIRDDDEFYERTEFQRRER